MDQITNEFDISQQQPSTLDLDIDVTFQKKRFTSLHLEEPTAKQVEKAELELGTNTRPMDISAYQMRRYQIALVAAVAQVPREVVLELKHSELMRAANFLRDLLQDSPPDGAS